MYKLVLVDDELLEIEQLERLIKRVTEAFEIICFTNSVAALEYIKNNVVDIVLTDIRMPNMDGIALIKEIKKVKSDLNIVVLSGYAEFEYAKEAMHSGVRHYLSKPVSKNELQTALNETLDELDSINNPDSEPVRFLQDICIGWYESVEEMQSEFAECGFPFNIKEAYGSIISVDIKRNANEHTEEYEKSITDVLSKIFCERVYVSYNERNSYICYIFGNKNIDTDFIVESLYNSVNINADVRVLEVFSALEDIDGKKIYSTETRVEMLVSKIILSDNKKIAKRITAEYKKTQANSGKMGIGGVNALLSDKQRDMMEKIFAENNVALDTNGEDCAEKAKKYIHENYKRKITWEDVAKSVHMNPSYFSRYFRKKVGIGFHDYLLKCRLDKVKELLATNEELERIATETGFTDARTLRRNFKLFEGISVSEYKKKM